MQRKDLIGLENKLGLHAQHGGAVLSTSAGMALLLQQFRPKLCQCDFTVGVYPIKLMSVAKTVTPCRFSELWQVQAKL